MKLKTKNRAPISTVLFDMDDTLLNSFKARDDTVRRVLKSAGVALEAGWSLANHRGYEIKDILRRSGASENQLETLYLNYRRIYWTQEHTPVKLYAGVREMLQSMYNHGIKLGVVTTKGRDFLFEGYQAGAVVELQKVGISQLLQVIVGFEDVTHPKPDPQGINLALEKLKVKPEEALYVGDSLADMLAAQKAGCRSCHAHWGADKLEGFQTDYAVASPPGLLKIVLPA